MSEATFFCSVSTLPDDRFLVASFSGEEEMSGGYSFEILLLSQNGAAEGDLIRSNIRFGIHRPHKAGGDVFWHGVACEAGYLGNVRDWHKYRILFVPKSWKLRRSIHSRVFIDQTLPEMIEDLLRKEHLTAGIDFRLKTIGTYQKNPFACQYNESAFAFMSRHMERLGIYSFMDQDASGACLVLADAAAAHTPLPQGDSLPFAAPSGLLHQDAAGPEEVMHAFSRSLCRQPGTVRLLDYNTERPTMDLNSVDAPSGPPDADPIGQITLFGDDYDSPEEGRMLARVYAESLTCRSDVFQGKSHIPYLRPGYTFTLKNHPRKDYEKKYLLLSVRHEGSATASLTASLGLSSLNDRREGNWDGYGNSFTCIPASVQYRSERKTERPRIYGLLNAIIDVPGTGIAPVLDEQGRYTVKLPFDTEERSEGNSSIPLRMMQPHAGEGSGIHFPLRKKVEVLLAFIDGNPDRPVIVGALPNPETPSPVTAANQEANVLATPGGHRIEMDDTNGAKKLTIISPDRGSSITIIN